MWINSTDNLYYPKLKLEFKTDLKDWTATLLTFTQPIKLTTKYEDGKLIASAVSLNGITEGPAQICLKNENNIYFYEVSLQNEFISPVKYKDYRSPKTVNPDSSLLQQKIIHSIDSFRNIVITPAYKNYFHEEEILLLPEASITQAITSEPITSYYVLPGSCESIPVKFTYNDTLQSYLVTAGLLKDKYNNVAANGTKLNFIYFDSMQTYIMEASLLNGFAKISIPSPQRVSYNLIVKINNTYSSPINLQVK